MRYLILDPVILHWRLPLIWSGYECQSLHFKRNFTSHHLRHQDNSTTASDNLFYLIELSASSTWPTQKANNQQRLKMRIGSNQYRSHQLQLQNGW